MIEQQYLLPITGTITDWQAFSGDPEDPVKPFGFNYFLQNVYAGEIQGNLLGSRIIEYKPQDCEAIVEITAKKEIHDSFFSWLNEHNGNEELAETVGTSLLTCPTDVEINPDQLKVFHFK